MLDYVFGHDEIVANFVASLIPDVMRGFGRCKTIGIVQDAQLIAGLVYHNWNPEAGVIQISAAALPKKYWMTPETLKRMYQYPFLQLGCQTVLNVVHADDERQLLQLAAFNYALVKIPRLLGRDSDAVFALLTREDWENNKFCKRWKHHIADDEVERKAA